MKQKLTLLLFLLSFSFWSFGQKDKELSPEEKAYQETKAVNDSLIKVNDDLFIIGIDQKIDVLFKPFSERIQGWVFTSVNVGESDKPNPKAKEASFLLEQTASLKLYNDSLLLLKERITQTLKSKEGAELQKELKDLGIVQAKYTEKSSAIKKAFVISNPLNIPIVLIVLILGALFFTIYFKFPNILYLGLAIKTVRGDYYTPPSKASKEEDNPDTIRDESAEGEVTPFQALTAALSATVGLGNIAGVAVALSVGGPGATFWMILAGLLGMSSKFTECTLGVKYREIDADGTVHGGPMYYLKKGLAERGLGGLGTAFAYFFALMCVGGSFGGGNMFQANQAASQFLTIMYPETIPMAAKTIFGVIVAVLVGVVIIGGIKRIGQVTEKVVPFMAILYVGAALVIIGLNITVVPQAVGLIFEGAFAPSAALGGLVGVLIQGFQRAAFSNEAGVGSAAIAHSAVRTSHPASEGMVALLEPFIDTVVICTMTALVLIITNIDANFMEYGSKVADGVSATSQAFESTIPGASYVLTIAVVLFAFSTMLSWSYYGLQAWKFLFGKSKAADLVYKITFCCFVVIGSAASLGSVIGFSDAMIFAMVFPNVIGLLLLAPKVKEEVVKYIDFTKNYQKPE